MGSLGVSMQGRQMGQAWGHGVSRVWVEGTWVEGVGGEAHSVDHGKEREAWGHLMKLPRLALNFGSW